MRAYRPRPTRILPVALLLTACSSSALPADPPTRFPAAERIVAIGDLHGDLAATRRALRLAGAIDENDRWIGGRLVVVQTGDQLDRGDGEQAILDLLHRLRREAARAGGALHALNANHELMNASGNFRYTTEGGFKDFEDVPGIDVADTAFAELEPERRARAAALLPGGPYARILAERNCIAIVGDNVFVHGGLLPEHLDYGIERINQEMRDWLRGQAPRPDWIDGSLSPVWSRHYSSDPDSSDCAMLAEVLERLGARRMIVGHTVQEEGITARCEGRVWCIDTGLSAHYGGPTEVLEIRGDRVTALQQRPPI